MKKNYHKRTNYLKLYKFWCKEFCETPHPETDMLSNYQLICEIEKLITKHNLLPFTEEEKIEIAEAMDDDN